MRRIAITLLCAACASKSLYPNDPQERTFRGDRDTVYDAIVRALTDEGFQIHVADPHRLRVEGKAGERFAIVQGIDRGGTVLVQIGMVRAEARDFQRLFRAIEKELP